jgi:hypothetical protein
MSVGFYALGFRWFSLESTQVMSYAVACESNAHTSQCCRTSHPTRRARRLHTKPSSAKVCPDTLNRPEDSEDSQAWGCSHTLADDGFVWRRRARRLKSPANPTPTPPNAAEPPILPAAHAVSTQNRHQLSRVMIQRSLAYE